MTFDVRNVERDLGESQTFEFCKLHQLINNLSSSNFALTVSNFVTKNLDVLELYVFLQNCITL